MNSLCPTAGAPPSGLAGRRTLKKVGAGLLRKDATVVADIAEKADAALEFIDNPR